MLGLQRFAGSFAAQLYRRAAYSSNVRAAGVPLNPTGGQSDAVEPEARTPAAEPQARKPRGKQLLQPPIYLLTGCHSLSFFQAKW